MQPNELNLAADITGCQRYLFLQIPLELHTLELAQRIDGLGQGMLNLHDVTGPPSKDSLHLGCYQMLRGQPERSSPGDLDHSELLHANVLIRLDSSVPEPLLRYKTELRQLIEVRGAGVESQVGVQQPRSYTSQAMIQFAYEPAQGPSNGEKYPLGVVTPLNKTRQWWALDWMHRHSFFLPRYDGDESMVAKGHALAAAAGISCITRRLMHSPDCYAHQQGACQ